MHIVQGWTHRLRAVGQSVDSHILHISSTLSNWVALTVSNAHCARLDLPVCIVQGWTHRLRAVGQKQAPFVSTLSRDICTLAWESGLPNNRLESRVMEKSKHLDPYGDFACI